MKHFLVQFGSGSPGEVLGGETEYKVLQEMNINNPAITYIPFHHLNHQTENDWTKVLQLYQPHTNKKIELLELYNKNQLFYAKEILSNSDIIILGSGICEPWIQILFESGLNKHIYDCFARGISILGYSAGGISLCDSHITTLFFREFFLQFNHIISSGSHSSIQNLMNSVLYEVETEFQEELRELFLRQKPIDPLTHPLSNEVFAVTRMPALGFLATLSVLPHFEQAPHATTQHLWHALNRFSRYTHIGLPNGTSLFHTYSKQCLKNTIAIGHSNNPNIKITKILKRQLIQYNEGEYIDI